MSGSRTIQALLLATSMTIPSAFAGDIVESVAGGAAHSGDGGYFELGASLSYLGSSSDVRLEDEDSLIPSLLISGVYQYKGLFAEMIHQSQDGINLGFNFWNSENWSLDLLAANLMGSYSRLDGVDPSQLDEFERNLYLLSEEDSLYVGAGIRATRYWDNQYVLQLRLMTDYYDDQGVFGSARLGKSWQVRNWNFHILGSVEYASATLNQHLYGVSREEATTLFPEYKPDASLSFGVEVGAAYPITQNLVFRGFYRFWSIPGEVSDSPFVVDDHSSMASVSISYVF
ncbi:MipA/OmpV family protein [Ferrimonas aestuarii]|uniref:MipA/OmpV family protein n=2 Tax=Ferrimonas aestuarii TaxID=2569539 RepID=A0A4U1BQH5_9GAMM|nr:MipA/OmpV family protein [Ferrimonas aestuarii]